MPLEVDIADRVRTDFGTSDCQIVLDELFASGKTGRIARCIVLAAGGSVERLRELIRMADADYRDVIVAGEYDIAMRCLRDLRVSFLVDSPDHFWIAETAVTAHKHGYRLTKVNSRAASVGPFEYTCDRSEGVAIFSDRSHTITIRKHNRLWSIIPQEGLNLRPFGLDAAFDDEEGFWVQLGYYLARKCAGGNDSTMALW